MFHHSSFATASFSPTSWRFDEQLQPVAPPAAVYGPGTRGRRRLEDDDDLRDRVEAWDELIALRRAATAGNAAASEVAAVAAVDVAGPPLAPDAAERARLARRRNDEALLMLMLLAEDDD